MKKTITLLAFLLLTTIIFAQQDIKKRIHNDILQKEQGLKFEKDLSKVEFPTLRNINGTIWVQDSSYSYSFIDGNEYLDSKKRVYTRDEFGHATIEMNHFWDDNTQDWIKRDTITTLFYNENQQKKYFERPWNTELQEWADTSKYEEYTEGGNSLLSYSCFWHYDSNEFSNRKKDCYILDESGNYLYKIVYEWNSNIQEWIILEKKIYTYDENGNVLYILGQDWESGSSSWIDAKQLFLSYDENGNIIQRLYKIWDFTTSSWISSSQALYNYDINENLIQYLYQNWNNETTVWLDNFQVLFAYDENSNLTKVLDQFWDNEMNDWKNENQELYTYSTNGKQTLFQFQYWDNETNSWANNTQYLYTYDGNGNLAQKIGQGWHNETWNNYSKTDYYWSEYEVEKVNSQENNTLIYPNPANNIIRIEGINNAKISIYSIDGKLIKQTKLQNNEVDVSDLQKGAYMIKITSDKQIFTKQIIKE